MESPALESRDGDAASSRLNTLVAITVALLATFMGIAKVKDDNIVQAMQQAQADKIDHWSFYQARNIREEIARAERTSLSAGVAGRAHRPELDSAIASYQALERDQNTKKKDLQAQAEQDQKTYDALNYRDDQFDLADALLAIAISMLALTSLTQKRWLFWVAMIPTAFGVLMGLAGLAGWHIHPDAISRLLS
jgi:Domain of unknown function (DUF4337)